MFVTQGDDQATDVAVAERWLLGHGLPWFLEAEHRRAVALLSRRRLLRVLAVCVAAGAVAGLLTGALGDAASSGVAVGATAAALAFVGWAAVQLSVDEMAGWALRRTVRQIGLLVPLATRALPLLLIFTVFFFINAEVWQVAATMPPGVLWLTVLLFTALAVLFLVARLPEEVERVLEEVRRDGVAHTLAGTPFADRADDFEGKVHDVQLTRMRRLNLLLVLLVIQIGQVLLLALAVFGFFVLFGAVAIEAAVAESWTGTPVTGIGWQGNPVTVELLQVAVFLAAFSGLYFTVYAVTDSVYREQFFTQITTELEHAVGVSTVYQALRRAVPE